LILIKSFQVVQIINISSPVVLIISRSQSALIKYYSAANVLKKVLDFLHFRNYKKAHPGIKNEMPSLKEKF
jgi:hypothetical protein